MSEPVYTLLVIVICGLIAAGLAYLAIKKTRLFVILLGIVALLAALPVAVMAEIGMNGCCGAPSTGHEGEGYALGALLGLAGLILLIFNGKFRKKPPK